MLTKAKIRLANRKTRIKALAVNSVDLFSVSLTTSILSISNDISSQTPKQLAQNELILPFDHYLIENEL